jgi:hypothetical protein
MLLPVYFSAFQPGGKTNSGYAPGKISVVQVMLPNMILSICVAQYEGYFYIHLAACQ